MSRYVVMVVGAAQLMDFWGCSKIEIFETKPCRTTQRGKCSPFLEGEVLGGQGVSRRNFKKITLAAMENERPIGGAYTYVANGTSTLLALYRARALSREDSAK